MTGAALAQWSGFLAPFIALAGVVIAKRFDRGAQREMYPAQVIASLQAELDSTRSELNETRDELREMRKEARDARDEASRRERLLLDYVHQLRDAVAKGNPPPPPAWPEGLNA